MTGSVLMTKLYNIKYGITIFPSHYFYPIHWHGIKDANLHNKINLPNDSYMFQYGISTNNLVYKILLYIHLYITTIYCKYI